MQPPLAKARQTRQPLRSERPLAYDKLSDPILVKRARDGDPRALGALCERHLPRVQRLTSHLLRDPEDARDASQDALAKLCAHLHQFRGEARFATWLHRLVVNACRDVAARRRSWEPLDEDRRAAPDSDPAYAAERAELRSELGAHLAGLAPAQARVVVLKDALDFSFEEISAVGNMPVGTAKCYAHRARARLRERIARAHAA